MMPKRVENIIQLFIYVFSFFLLTEWMRPVSELTDTGNMKVFILFIILSLAVYFFSLHWLARSVVLIGYIAAVVYMLYDDTLFSIGELKVNIAYVWSGDWVLMTNSFRTLLFFALLWLVTYLIHYWIYMKSNLFFFFSMTVILLAILDTFTLYNASAAIVRVVIAGIMILGVMKLVHLFPALSLRLLGKWFMSLIVMAAFFVSMGLLLPKPGPQWPDPIPFIQAFSEEAKGEDGAASVSKVGYSEDDSKLGGSIEPDSSVVFYHTATTNDYWKVESKNVYTGKGWVSSVGEGTAFPLTNGDELTELENYERPEQVDAKALTASVSIMEDQGHILYPAGSYLKNVKADGVSFFLYEPNLKKLTPQTADGTVQDIGEYIVNYEQPRYDLVQFRKVTEADETMDVLMDLYTQLPDSIPSRVYDLARELTENQSNWYDKVKAVEDYFDQPQFVYSKEDISYPAKDQDYVDQFLFETRIGYCDNYSTSMVVLLRAAGIPARWAKGYTEGERTVKEGEVIYQVTNNNAHSWVEVYFSGIGWVPFEPTKGFSSEPEFINSDRTTHRDTEHPTVREDQAETLQQEEKNAVSEQRGTTGEFIAIMKPFWISLGTVVIVVLSLFLTRRKWVPRLLIARYKRKSICFSEAYEVLVKQLHRAGLKRLDGQTFREYAAYIDSVYDTNLMTKLTRRYEIILYRGDEEGEAWRELQESWETLMRKTSS
ncbi:transglutaminase domain-containing protein [Peribacillus asahii]|uniref:transglutaminase domain-containing protein n=1 Tax=Peribacillus asahii TaxID=228899 RepID=UPI0020798FAA|nr:transglutaminase domain-containing protein [Peribacillus asahii]USK60215.1 transglutaminase [Peribacillus asahii]